MGLAAILELWIQPYGTQVEPLHSTIIGMDSCSNNDRSDMSDSKPMWNFRTILAFGIE